MELLPNPWTEPAAFDRFAIAGVIFTGKVDLDAGTLLKKKSDHRRARGRNGGRTVAAGWDLVEFSVTLSAHDEDTLAQIQDVLRRVGRGGSATQDTSALSVSHPYLDAVGISQATLDEAGFVPVQGGGMMGLRLKLKEFRPPAQNVGARAPSAAAQNTAPARTSAKGQFGTFTQSAADGTTTTLQRDATATPLGPPQPIAPRAPARPSSGP